MGSFSLGYFRLKQLTDVFTLVLCCCMWRAQGLGEGLRRVQQAFAADQEAKGDLDRAGYGGEAKPRKGQKDQAATRISERIRFVAFGTM